MCVQRSEIRHSTSENKLSHSIPGSKKLSKNEVTGDSGIMEATTTSAG